MAGHSDFITSSNFIDENVIVTSSYDKKVNFWDLRSSKITKTINEDSPVWQVKPTADGLYLGLAMESGAVAIYSV